MCLPKMKRLFCNDLRDRFNNIETIIINDINRMTLYKF